MPNRTRQHGFTIIELLVTMTILGLMLFLVNQLFNDTSRAVTTSVQVSKAVAASRSINEQMTKDAQAMVGPGLSADGGYIVIIQQRLTDVTMFDPQTLAPLNNGVELRSDQLLFIRDAEGLRSMTPSGTNSYGTNLIGQAGDRAKVWYGHPQRTLPNGQPRTGANTGLGESNADLERIGSSFILGRQAMLFNPTDASTNLKLAANTTGYTFSGSGYYNASVTGSGYGGGAAAYLGLSDVTDQDYGPAGTAGTLLNQLQATPANYPNTAYPVAANRLHVNPAPSADITNYASWAIAQAHPIFAPGCSEVIIDFAADLNGDGNIDTEFNGQSATTGAPIYWYDGLQSNFTWANPGNGIDPRATNTLNQDIFVFRVDDDTAHPGPTGTPAATSSWPYLIRVRYRLHDTRGRLGSNYANALRDGLDNDGDGDTDEVGEDRISGRWFERILSVPRP